MESTAIIIKSPESKIEFDQIFGLNYQTFVEEIPQHQKRADKKLIDKFHSKNNYLIAKVGEQLVGMVCYNTKRPFSLDEKNVNIDEYLSKEKEVAEIRLLSVRKNWRKTTVTFRLLKTLIQTLLDKGIDFALISGAVDELNFYKKIGFKSFGKRVGKEGAYYQPMYISIQNLRKELNHD